MAGEKAISKPLRPVWLGNQARADAVQPSCGRRIALIGVGVPVSSALTQLTKLRTQSARTIAVDIDSTKLDQSKANRKALIPEKATQKPFSGHFSPIEIGAEEVLGRLDEALTGVDIAFIVARLNDWISARAAPAIAEIARRKGALTFGVVTKHFRPGDKESKRISYALNELQMKCDTVAVIDNAELTRLTHQLSVNGEGIADQMLANIVASIVNTLSELNLTETDPAEFRNVIKRGGLAAVGIGESSAPNRATSAVLKAFENPLLSPDRSSTTDLLAYIIGDSKMTIEEANTIEEMISRTVGNRTRVICSASMDSELAGTIRVILVMTGVDAKEVLRRHHRIDLDLYNLEPRGKPETKLPISLGLYQLETFES